MNKELPQVPATGLGHQMKADQKAFESCIKSLEEASMQIVKQKPFYPMKFRKMTRKSMIGFGSYKEQTVERMLKQRPFDLCKMYFKLSQITFFDDILDELKITAEWRIEKPGRQDEKYLEFMTSVFPEELKKRIHNLNRRTFKDANNALKAIHVKDRHKGYHQSLRK